MERFRRGSPRIQLRSATLSNIKQPLPDILILEPARKNDPLTADYDRKIGRNPRYWRDMSDEEYQRKMDEIKAKQKRKPTTGPKINIFKDEGGLEKAS